MASLPLRSTTLGALNPASRSLFSSLAFPSLPFLPSPRLSPLPSPSSSSPHTSANGPEASLRPKNPLDGSSREPTLLETLKGLWDMFPPIVLAVPKKRSTHRKTRMRTSGTGPKDKRHLDHCKACGAIKLHAHICASCWKDIQDTLRNEKQVRLLLDETPLHTPSSTWHPSSSLTSEQTNAFDQLKQAEEARIKLVEEENAEREKFNKEEVERLERNRDRYQTDQVSRMTEETQAEAKRKKREEKSLEEDIELTWSPRNRTFGSRDVSESGPSW